MIEKARLEQGDNGIGPRGGGWYVLYARDVPREDELFERPGIGPMPDGALPE